MAESEIDMGVNTADEEAAVGETSSGGEPVPLPAGAAAAPLPGVLRHLAERRSGRAAAQPVAPPSTSPFGPVRLRRVRPAAPQAPGPPAPAPQVIRVEVPRAAGRRRGGPATAWRVVERVWSTLWTIITDVLWVSVVLAVLYTALLIIASIPPVVHRLPWAPALLARVNIDAHVVWGWARAAWGRRP